MGQSRNRAAWVESIIKKFIRESPENTLQNEDNEETFEDALVGFSTGDDALYAVYKNRVTDVGCSYPAFHQSFRLAGTPWC
jgi:hypothetical protein